MSFIHTTAVVEPGCFIGANTSVWHFAHVREGTHIGHNCVLGKDVFVDHHVKIGNYCKIQNGVSVYHGVTLEDAVFVGPHVTFTNDLTPRARGNWALATTLIKRGASLGAHATIIANTVIGECAMVAAGSVVTRSVPDHGLVRGNPARLVGYVCPDGHTMQNIDGDMYECRRCGTLGKTFRIIAKYIVHETSSD